MYVDIKICAINKDVVIIEEEYADVIITQHGLVNIVTKHLHKSQNKQ